MLKSLTVALGVGLFSFAAQAADYVQLNGNCAYVKSSDDSQRVYSDGRVYNKVGQCWQATGQTVGSQGFQEIASKVRTTSPSAGGPDRITAEVNQSHTIRTPGNANVSIHTGGNANVSINARGNANTTVKSGGTANTTIAGKGNSNTTIANSGRQNVSRDGSGPATMRYAGLPPAPGARAGGYYNGR